jgi:hypothetical protein
MVQLLVAQIVAGWDSGGSSNAKKAACNDQLADHHRHLGVTNATFFPSRNTLKRSTEKCANFPASFTPPTYMNLYT